MKSYYFLSILLLLLSCFLSSCGTTARTNGHYASSEAGVLEISEKDDLKVAGSLSMSGLGDGINVQAGYSPIKHIAIASSYIGMSHNRSNGSKGLTSTNFNLIEGSIGTYYFLPFKKQSKDIGMLADIYAGCGLGSVKNEYGGEANSSLNFNQYYIQGGLHLRMKWFGISYLIKRTRLDYTKGKINYVTWNSGYFEELNNLQSAPFSLNGRYLR